MGRIPLFTISCLLSFMAYQHAVARDLTLEERFRAQEAIERVYWEHRVWPSENRSPKPSLETVLSSAQIRARVVDYLRKSNALAAIWSQPITAEQLQAEVRRMAAETQAPDVLRELFATLGDDPQLIAETLARPGLADRLIREAYVRDEPRVGETRHRPQEAQAEERSRMPFDAWWAATAPSVSDDVMAVSGTLEAVEIPADAPCVPDTWRTIPEGGEPPIGHPVWTGSEMIFWGQYVSGSGPTSVARYNPATNSWTVTFPADAPSIRYDYTTVWTGEEMIIWGGSQNTGAFPDDFLNDGGRYDPTTDSWRKTSTGDGTPVRRSRHTAVWTGSEMIVWGGGQPGATGFVVLNDGARYDPSTDTWAAVKVDEPRADHVAVWTGSEMIVWGGFGLAFPQVGGRYNPSTDTWLHTTSSGAPARRSGTTAVWTGREMIIWGGNGGYYLNTGARYDPSLDLWTETSLRGAPEARSNHSAVWTGHEMIIWGGNKGGDPFSGGGGRYNPSFNTWVPVSPLGAPSAPFGAALWTGSEMLFWVGYGGTRVAPGGRYCASTCEGPTTFYTDADGDGYGNPRSPLDFCAPASGYVDTAGDCDDSNAAIHPGAVETCNGIDDNCDGHIDEGFGVGTACTAAVDACHKVVGLSQCLPDGTGTQCAGTVSLLDDTPPTLALTLDPSVLWPPNHQLVPVHITWQVSDACDSSPRVVLVSATSNEPDDAPGGGDGSTTGDIAGADLGTADGEVILRAERSNSGQGRIYTLTYSAVDSSGNSTQVQGVVTVPLAMGRATQPSLVQHGIPAKARLNWTEPGGTATSCPPGPRTGE